MYLIVGLGNPGSEYEVTRHNIGRLVLRSAAARWSIRYEQFRSTQLGKGHIESHPVVLALLNAWMNQSGLVVRNLLDELGLSPANLIVVQDDLDLPLGRLRIKSDGGDGGHKGIRSILENLDIPHFARVKIGIGRAPTSETSAEYVLSSFYPEEQSLVDDMLIQAVNALECLVTHGVSEAMNRFNIRRKA